MLNKKKSKKCQMKTFEYCSVVDPEWLIPDPDRATNFKSSGSEFYPFYLSPLYLDDFFEFRIQEKVLDPQRCFFNKMQVITE